MPYPTRLLHPVAMAAALAATGLFAVPSARAQAAAMATQPIDIPAQAAGSALKRFVEVTAFQLVYNPDAVRGVSTNTVSGDYAPRQALAKMLEGTGIKIVDTGDNAATLTNAGETASLDTVVITATKRASTAREVAGNVTALQGDDLEQRGAVGYEEYLRQAPGVQFNKSDAGYATLSVRGLTTATSVVTTQGTTGVYVEDVPFTDPYSVIALPDLGAFDLERVEVLRGPQGVLFGSASLGGALRFVLNKPNLKRNEGSVQVTGSSTSGGGANYALAAMGNFAAASQEFALRVVAYDREDSGYIKNTVTGEERINGTRQQGGRVLATWKPTQQLSVTGTVMSEQTRVDDSSTVSDPGKFETNVATRQPRVLTTDFGNLQVNYDIGPARLTSNTGYVRKKANITTDVGRSLGAFFGNQLPVLQAQTNNTADAFSQEIRIANREPSSVNWLGGLFYQRFRERFVGGFGGPGVSGAAQTLFGPLLTPSLVAQLTSNDTFFTQNIPSTAKETAAFGEVEWRFTDRWTVTAGARAYKTEMELDSNTAGLLNFFSLGAPASSSANSTSDSGVTPKLSLKYTSSGGDMWYVLASKGYRFGGVNIIPPLPGTTTPTAFKSDNLWNYETGVRLAMLDRKLFVDVTGFVMDWTNAQINVVRPDSFVYVDNVGKARSMGAELSVRYRPVSPLTLAAGLAYIDARTKADSSVAPSNSRLPGTAHLQSLLDASYQFEGPLGSTGVATLTYSHIGTYYNDLERTAKLGGYGIADVNVRFAYDRYELTLFARNLANEKGKVGASAAPTLPYADYYLTKPRTVGVTLRADF